MNERFAEIRRAFEEERRAPAPLVSAEQLPVSYEAITPQWLTSVLAAGRAGPAVVSHRLGEPDEGTSSRRRIFLEWNDAGAAAGMPRTVFCKGTPTLESRYMLALNGGIEAEVTFYRAVRPALPIEAPRAYHARFDPRSFNSIIVMRDLAGEVEFCNHTPPATLDRARSQMSLLATLHGRYWRSPELETTLAPFNTWERFFTVTVEEAGFGESCPRGVETAGEVVPARLRRRAAEIWPATWKSVERHRELPRTLVHSDVHLKNWYVTSAGVMGVNDWQCTCKGNWGRDVSYAISTALDVEERRAWERDLLRFYLDRLEASGGGRVPFDEAWTIYRQQLFTALAWWTGTLGQPPEAPRMQPAETSLEFIRRMAHAIDDLEALDAFGRR